VSCRFAAINVTAEGVRMQGQNGSVGLRRARQGGIPQWSMQYRRGADGGR